MEEGEIVADEQNTPQSNDHPFFLASRQGASEDASGKTYSSALEWPGDAEPQPLESPDGLEAYAKYPIPTASASCLRLLVRHSSVLRRPKALALLDGYSEIQIGRDLQAPGADVPKIRLKDLEVSKLHATIYWDTERSQWSIVDMGSKHGTFVQHAASAVSASGPAPAFAPASTAASAPDTRGARLSQPRVASVPKALHHLDHLSVGGTTFVVHIHDDGLPCTDCSPQAGEEIPLFPANAPGPSTAGSKRKLDAITVTHLTEGPPRNPKKALAMLKRSLLSSGAPIAGRAPVSAAPHYVDRSARRRTLYPDHSPATGNEHSQRSSPSIATPATSSPSTSVPASSIPISANNIGHRLLMKQGWQPGTALGDSSIDSGGLLAPLEPPSTSGRAGLGAPVPPAVQNGDWRDVGKQRRWAEARNPNSVVP
ncbi:hypothetical protein C2E23DRAFT_721870 [Lenzites betulinus]|nr:hypothetical protein C2E23DRAFT_721870 [Lenzites betulinus]